jgi:hypothetical protein
MVLARNTYRFGLLVVAYAIASGIDTMGGYGVEGIAALGLGIGSLGLFGGTLAHLARGPDDGGGDGATGGGSDDDGVVDSSGEADANDTDDAVRTGALGHGWY